MDKEELSNVLSAAAGAAANVLTAAGVNPSMATFTIVIWAPGAPQFPSFITAGQNTEAQHESAVALANASEKSKLPPTAVRSHRSSKPKVH